MKVVEAFEPRRLLAAGFFDPSFGEQGTTTVPGDIYSVAVQTDGRVLLLSHLNEQTTSLLRLTRSGSIDRSFGRNGRVSFPNEILTTVHANSDGTVLVGSNRAVRRLLPSGGLDRRFGGQEGFIATASGRFAVDLLGRILVIDDTSLRRYHVGGTPDKRWGNDGVVEVYSRAGHEYSGEISRVIFQPSGRVVALASEYQEYSSPSTFVGLSPRGRLDRNFGTNGIAGAGNSRGFNDLAVGIDSLIFRVWSTDDADTYLVRYSADGQFDQSFSNNDFAGIKLTADLNYVGLALFTQPDGKIVLVGIGSQQQRDGEQINGAVVYRLNADGTRDHTFRYDGRADFGHVSYDNYFSPRAAAMSPDGSLFVGGADYQPFVEQQSADFNIAKLDLSGDLPPLYTLSSGLLRVTGTAGRDQIEVTQDQPGGPVRIRVNGDFVSVNSAGRGIVVDAAAGDDRIYVSTTIPATVVGGRGNDLIQRSGPGVVSGGQGRDTLYGDESSQDFQGGGGFDLVSYSDAFTDLVVRLDNIANDGRVGERDNVRSDVEGVIGGTGNDLIVGDPSFNLLEGGSGDDTLWGGAGNDTLRGGPGIDQLMGQAGTDVLEQENA